MKYGLIGYPLGHSYSAIIHQQLGICNYELKSLTANDFKQFMQQQQFDGINVTIPYKQQVIPFLTKLDKISEQLQAVNTIVKENNDLIGYNTDYYGFLAMIEDLDFKNKKVLVLGNGGASKAIVLALKTKDPQEILVVSRKDDNTLRLAEIYKQHQDVQIIVNTTPVGMYPRINESWLDLDKLTKVEVVLDIIYNPLRTLLIQQAQKKGIKTKDGLKMLVAQAIYANQHFQNKKIDLTKTKVIQDFLRKQQLNYVLIGMPSAGKTTIAQILAKKYDYDFIDSDDVIEQRTGLSCKEYILQHSEAKFRLLEQEVIQELSLKHHCIISTGGGVIENLANINYLKGNGIIIFIDRPLAQLKITQDRPLSNSISKLEKLYQSRYQLYLDNCDYKIENNQEIEQVIRQIEKVMGEVK